MYPDASFLYIAGDLTEWELFFNQPGNSMFNSKFNGRVAAMDNHDASNGGSGGIVNHFKFGSVVAGVPVSYAFDYGAARMIILNLENAYSAQNEAYPHCTDSVPSRRSCRRQREGPRYHKSLYSGADHMDDSDVIANRKYWGPVLAELGVDFVLQGHDHVLSRGFINADGYKVDITR